MGSDGGDQTASINAVTRAARKSDTTQEGYARDLTCRIKPRVLGAALFGLLCGGYVQNTADRTIPAIISMVQRIDLETAYGDYQSSAWYHTSVLLIGTFMGAAAAGFLARRKGILAGILSGSLHILVAAYILFVSIAPQYFTPLSRLPLADDLAGDASVQFQALLRLVLFTLAAFTGGFLGHRLYDPPDRPRSGPSQGHRFRGEVGPLFLDTPIYLSRFLGLRDHNRVRGSHRTSCRPILRLASLTVV
jgi:hypothetical protein